MSWPTDRWPLAQEIVDRVGELANDSRFSGMCTLAESNHATPVLGIKPNYVRIGKGSGGAATRSRVVFVGGHHAREWAPPTALTNLISALLEAKVNRTTFTFNDQTFGPPDMDAIFENVDLYILPLVNPDGYDFSQLHDVSAPPTITRGWRKNRRPPPSPMPAGATCVPNPADPADPPIGVDVNRNYDVLWKFEDFYIVSVPDDFPQNSNDPCNITGIFGGASAFSEAESQNVKELVEQVDPQFYVDVHMAGGTVLHSWGTAIPTTVSDPTPPLAQTRIRDTAYREPIGQNFFDVIRATANLMADATEAATPGNRYDPQPGAQSASIAGASDDWAFSRNLGTARAPTQSFTLECGKHFLPDFNTEFPQVQREVHAALLALLRLAAGPLATTGPDSCRRCHC